MGSIRTKYDEKGRISSRVVTDDAGRPSKYVYTYRGDSDKPCRIGKNFNHVSNLILQVDDMNRETFRLDEETGLSYKTFYGIRKNDMVDALVDVYKVAIPDEYFTITSDDLRSVTYVTDPEENLVMLKIVPVEAEATPVCYDDDIVQYYNKVIDESMFKFPEIPNEVETESYEYTFYLKEKEVCAYERKLYAKRGYTARIDYHDVINGTIDRIFNFEVKAKKSDYTFLVHWHPDGKVTVNATMDYTNEEYPLIPKDSNITTRLITFSGDSVVSKKTADTMISTSDTGEVLHTSVFYDSEDKNNCYSLIRTVDPETGNPVRMFNSVSGEINIFEYNDQGLMTKNIVTQKEEPKKILYKGIKGFNSDARKPATVIQNWHFNDEGKLILFSSHNEFICNFTAFEYDDEGREIFQASFSSVNL